MCSNAFAITATPLLDYYFMSTDREINPWKYKKTLVTGATGLLGSHLTRFLVDAGAEVVALVRDSVPRSLFYSTESQWQLSSRVTTVRGSVEDFPLIERTINEYEIDTVFHLAAQTLVGTANQSPLETFRVNIQGTANILEAVRLNRRHVRRVIIASSDKAYGDLKGDSYDEHCPLQGRHPYDVSKSCADLISQAYFSSFGIPVAITRCGNFFGAGDLNFSRLIPGTIRDVLRDQVPVIRSDGQFIRDYIFVEDGVHAYCTLAEAMCPSSTVPTSTTSQFGGEAFNFSYGLRLSVVDVVNRILVAMKRTDLVPIIQNNAANEIPVQCLDSRKAMDVLAWRPRYGFDQGLAMTIDWYRQHYA